MGKGLSLYRLLSYQGGRLSYKPSYIFLYISWLVRGPPLNQSLVKRKEAAMTRLDCGDPVLGLCIH